MLEKLINASLVESEEWWRRMGAQYRPEVAEIFPRTRAGKRIDSAMRTIASLPSPPQKPFVMKVQRPWGQWGCGGRIPAEINSERRGIHRLSPPSPRKPFSSNYFANIAKRSRQASSSSFSPRVPINSRLPLRD